MTSPDLKIRQVAELLQLHPQSVLRLIHDGQLEAYRVGRRALRVPVDALERFLEERGR